jgi:hypothetical protein
MKKYHVLESLFLSFYSKPLYQDVAKQWNGFALGYFLLVIAICWLPFSYDFHRLLNHFSAQILPGIVSQIPTITISKGKLSIDKPVPYVIKEPGDGVPLILFDTSNQPVSIQNANAYVLITQDAMIVRDNQKTKSVKSYPFSKLEDVRMGPSQFSEFAKKFILFSSVLMYPVAIMISFLIRFLEALLFGGIALAIAPLFRVRFNYQAGVRLAIIALTPALFFGTFVDYFSIPLLRTHVWFFEFIVFIGYLLYAVRAQQEDVT